MSIRTYSPGRLLSQSVWCGNRRQGFSLVTVAALGALTMTWLFAISAAVIPMYQRASLGRHQTVLRSSAEAGIDYAVAELNAALVAGTTSPIDDTTEDNNPKKTTLPSAAITNSGAQVDIYVNNVPAPTWSAVYDESLDAHLGTNNPSSTKTSFFTTIGNKWRTVRVTATYAGLTKSILVVLKPVSQAQAIPNPQVSAPASTFPFFPQTLFAPTQLYIADTSQTDGWDSRPSPPDYHAEITGPVSTNGTATLAGTSTIGGDLEVHSKPQSSLLSVVAAGQPTLPVINNELILNGIGLSLVATPGATAQPADNVQGMASRIYNVPGPPGDSYDPIKLAQGQNQIAVPAAPSAPASAQNLGALAADGGQTVSLPPGDYIVNSISTSGSGKIQMVPSPATGSYGPTRFFIEGNNSGNNVVNISGTAGMVNPTTTPGNMQFWYSGAKDITISNSGTMYATTYAPNAKVTLNGSGIYYGSVVGNKVFTGGSRKIHFDQALKADGGKWGLNYSDAPTAPAPAGTAQGAFNAYKAITWRELQ